MDDSMIEAGAQEIRLETQDKSTSACTTSLRHANQGPLHPQSQRHAGLTGQQKPSRNTRSNTQHQAVKVHFIQLKATDTPLI